MDLERDGRHVVIYNVANRAVLDVRYVTYGDRAAREGRWLDTGPIVVVEERVDYVFAEPPESLRVEEGRSREKTVLGVADAEVEALTAVRELVQGDRMEQALAVARAELMVHPENAMLAGYAARALLGDDFGAQVELLRWCLQRVPDSVDVHRVYQDLWRGDRDSVRAEYASLLASHPRSAMYHYLAGRLESVASVQAQRSYRAALELDPNYGPAYRALGYHASMRGQWAEAVGYLDRFASLGAEQALEALEERIRLRHLLGRDTQESIRLLDELAALHPDDLYLDLQRSHLRLEHEPGRWGEECDAITRKARSLGGPDIAAMNLCAHLAITAGDLATARDRLRQVDPRLRHEVAALRLALSEGATPEDRELLTDIPNWDRTPYILVLPALEFLDPSERESVIAGWGDPDLDAVGRLLDTPTELMQPRRLDQLLAEVPLSVQAVVYLAAARRLASETSPSAVRARNRYLREARAMAVPGELPFMGRVGG